TLQAGRHGFPWREFVLAANTAEACSALVAMQSGPMASVAANPPPLAFMLSGQGSQHSRMTESLYRYEPVFRTAVDTCAELLHPMLGRDLRPILYPTSAGDEHVAALALQQTALAQPALFAVEYAW